MSKILVSSCLLGETVRYDGTAKTFADPTLFQWSQEGRLVSICPEILGGLGCPRLPAEIEPGGNAWSVIEGQSRIFDSNGNDCSAAFVKGAYRVLEIAKRHHIRWALLKARSPSCSSTQIYNGNFENKLTSGVGITTELLQKNGLLVFDENHLPELKKVVEDN